MTAFRIVSIAADGPCVVLEVAVAGVVHLVVVTPQGAVLVPAGLAQHPMRDELEAECRQVAAQARQGWVA